MLCKRCPHHVRHGQAASDGKTIEFKDKCGLRMAQNTACLHVPFEKDFNYRTCKIYHETFSSSLDRNSVVPRQDIDYSDKLGSGSITDMELL